MDAKDIRNLSEAYLEVYEEKSTEPDPFGRPGGKHGGVRKGGGYEKGYEAMKKKIKELEDRKRTNEQVDIYDIILSHLLDEGYAETPEAAQVIMVNMSEDWRESIMEADSLAAFQARREKRRAAMKKKTGYEGHDYSKPPAQAAAEREERMRKFINKD